MARYPITILIAVYAAVLVLAPLLTEPGRHLLPTATNWQFISDAETGELWVSVPDGSFPHRHPYQWSQGDEGIGVDS